MRKLRPTIEEKMSLIDDIIERLTCYNNGALEDFTIDNLLKEYAKLPEEVKKPILNISASAYVKMLELIRQSAVECSWHGLVHKEEDEYTIYDIIVFPQINSATTTSTDEDEFAKWQAELIMDPEFPLHELRMHGHSHVNMNVFSSGVDDQYQKDLITKVDNGDYYIFLIMNKKMEICAFIYDFEQQIMFETNDIDLRIVSNGANLIKWANKQLKDNARTATVATAKSYPRQVSFDDDDYDMPVVHYGYGRTRSIYDKGGKYGSK